MRIFLIGFMGAGKSFVGSRLAKLRGMDFIDLDEYIVAEAEMSIPEIFAKEGEVGFRLRESDALRQLAQRKNLLIACGGGTPCFFDNMDWMNAEGFTIFLDVEVALLQERLQSEMAQRPLLADKTPDQLRAYLSAKLAERRSYYEAARMIYRQQTGEEDTVAKLHQRLQFED